MNLGMSRLFSSFLHRFFELGAQHDMEQLNDILIIPDVHGRTFWKEAIDDMEDYDKVIFLGDYLDPYPDEGIEFAEAMGVLSSIVQLKVEYPDKVVLLLGNHDLHYFNPLYRDKAMCWRYDEQYADMAEEFFDIYQDIFQLAYEAEITGQHVLFTHAGVHSVWYEAHRSFIGKLNAQNLNKLLNTRKGIEFLSEVSRKRGGLTPVGSIVWNDLSEFDSSKDFPGIYQVFGHTQQMKSPIIQNSYACLDYRRAFYYQNDSFLMF